ncbi:hypothetical protein LCGC14_0341840, partial [marine sediment metagenome]
LDMSGIERDDPIKDYEKIRQELSSYGASLEERPEIIVGTKTDLPQCAENVEKAKAFFSREGRIFMAISSVTGDGVDSLLYETAALVAQARRAIVPKAKKAVKVYKLRESEEPGIERTGKAWKVTGAKIERIVRMTDLLNEEAIDHLRLRLERLGVDERLEKAGAVEVASSVNGQIMPPVMGAAAFLMVEYIGISYVEVIKHAFLPALISYIALVYIVHLEAVKAGMTGLQSSNPPRPFVRKMIGFLTGLILLMALSFGVYYGLGWLKPILGDNALLVISLALAVVYVGLLWLGSRYPALEMDDPDSPVLTLPQTRPTVLSGLHFILPVVVLIWCLMVERLSPGLSAFWATVLMIFIILTQRPLSAMFRGSSKLGSDIYHGLDDLWQGLVTGARNMIGIGIATATAGIIVGAVSQTGVGLVLADLVEILSMGNLMLMLILTAVLSLILGMGLPTTANYIVVSALLAPVIVTLGQQNGLIVPLIAVHLFVFYFGIMADVTPPVGLASFAAAAVSGGDPIRTGFQAFYYSLRTAALPFLFIFNTDLLLIDVSFAHGVLIFIVATVAMLIFAAGTQGWLIVKSRWYESVLLLLVAFTLFRPGFWMDLAHDPYQSVPPAQIAQALDRVDEGSNLRMQIRGLDAIGEPRTFYLLVPVPDGANGEERLQELGLELIQDGDRTLVDLVTYGSLAADLGFDFDQEIVEILAPVDRWAKEWMWIPGLLVFVLIIGLQWSRRRPSEPATLPGGSAHV